MKYFKVVIIRANGTHVSYAINAADKKEVLIEAANRYGDEILSITIL